MKRLSIIIVTYKSEADIYDCLASVWQFCDIVKEELEVIVVDNSPECEPMFSQLTQLYGDDVILIHNTHNGGYGQGNNVGIRRATAPVVMVMNPDVRMMEPVFKTAVEAFERDDKLCMYGMKQMISQDVRSPLSFNCSFRMNGYLTALLTPICNRIDCYLPRYMYFSGSCFYMDKTKFEAIGMFDEDNFMYGEEDDIHWRMARRFGYHFFYNKSLHYIHLTMERKPSLKTERAMLEAAVRLNGKKGFPAKRIIVNKMASMKVRRLKRRLDKWRGCGDDEMLQVMDAFLAELKTSSQFDFGSDSLHCMRTSL